MGVANEAVAFKTDEWGTFLPAAAQIRNSGDTYGEFTLLDGYYGQIQWGYRYDDRLAVGFNFDYTSLTTSAGQDGTTIATSRSRTYTYRVGVLSALASHWMVGLVADVATSPATLSLVDPDCNCPSSSNETTRQVLARVGVSYEYAEQSSLYLDYQYGRYWSAAGRLETSRVFTGIEHQVIKGFFARAGFALDKRGEFSPTAGLGIYPSDSLSIDIAYQYNMFPELGPEFGKSRLFGISCSMSF